MAPFLGCERSYIGCPQRQLDRYHSLAPQGLGHYRAEFCLGIRAGLADDIFLVQGLVGGEGVEHRAHKVVDIDKGQQLLLVAHTEIEVTVYALYHHQIVFLMRAVDSGGAEDNPRNLGMSLKIHLSLDFRQTVAGVGMWHRRGVHRCIIFFIADAERTQ